MICANALVLLPCAAEDHVVKAPFLVLASVRFSKTMDGAPRWLLHLYYSNLGAHLRRVTGSYSFSSLLSFSLPRLNSAVHLLQNVISQDLVRGDALFFRL